MLLVPTVHPSTPFGWIKSFRTNDVGLCIRSLLSKDKLVRELGLSLLASFLNCIEVSVFSLHFFNVAEVFISLGISRTSTRFVYPQSSQEPHFTIPSGDTLSRLQRSFWLTRCMVFSTPQISYILSPQGFSYNNRNWMPTMYLRFIVHCIVIQIGGKRTGAGSFVFWLMV
jgi:hypothetical protein